MSQKIENQLNLALDITEEDLLYGIRRYKTVNRRKDIISEQSSLQNR